VTRSKVLEWFLLGFGLKTADDGQGRSAVITPLWLAAKEKCGDCDVDEVLDALYNLSPNHAELHKFVAVGGGFQSVSFERVRRTPRWKDFFTTGDFRIKVLPPGRVRFQELDEVLAGARAAAKVQVGAADADRRFKEMAIEEARNSVPEDDRPHPKVGAVVVKNGSVLSKAHRGENPKPKSHAEYIALEDKLPDDLVAGATVYTTLEPCTTRRHPKIPCAQRLVERKVARVVIGMLDPNPDVSGKGWQLLRDHGIETAMFEHELMRQCEEMNREFIRAQKQKLLATNSADRASTIAARSLSDATRDLEKAARDFYALHAQHWVARAARDIADEEKQILQKIDAAWTVFAQDYDIPADLSAVAKDELGRINIALANLKELSVTGRGADMEIAATQIREACERIRTAARPYAYRPPT
jgi:pyrimidine deaminase RibD-like protein